MREETSPPKQRVWPLLLAALSLVAIGFGFALLDRPDEAIQRSPLPSPFLDVQAAPDAPESIDAVELAYGPADKAYRVDLRRERVASSGETVRTRVAVTVRDEAVSEARRWVRRYAEPVVQVATDDERIGAEISHELERLLVTSKNEVATKVTGEVTEYELITTEAAQLRQLLEVLRDGVSTLQPRVPRESVRPDEPWSWTVPVTAAAAGDSILEDVRTEVAGKMEFTARVVGATPEGDVLLEMTLRGEIEGRVLAEESTTEFENSGEGGGWAVWDLEAGRVERAWVRYRQRSSEGGDEFESAYHLALVATE